MKKAEENGQGQFANTLPPGRRSGHGSDKVRLSEICLDFSEMEISLFEILFGKRLLDQDSL